MFIKDKSDPLKLPARAKVTWVVKYQGGRKPFEDERTARRFLAEQRATEKGWGELIEQIEITRIARK